MGVQRERVNPDGIKQKAVQGQAKKQNSTIFPGTCAFSVADTVDSKGATGYL